jgi:membrane fusion protein (multidrug efflux system)
VKAGSLLVQMDDTELRANLAESEAERDNRQKLYDRALKLYASKNIPKAQVDLLLSELQASEAKIMADKARISDYQIRAPFAGKLGLREVSLGSLVRPADVITTLDDTDTIKVDFDLPESFLAEIDSGQAFHAKTVAYPDRVFEGFVETIATRINPATRSVRVRGVVPNKNGLMKPGMFLAVELQISLDTDVPMLAEEALVTTVNGHYVYAILEDKAIRSPVKIGRRVRGFVEIVDGLDKGAVVITEGLQKVKDGSSVNVTIVTPEVAVEATQ